MKIGNTEIISEGKFLKIGSIKSEWYLDNIEEPEGIIKECKKNRLNIDIFTFMQRIPETQPKYKFYMEWDNVAAVPITTFDFWWENQIKDKTRNMVRKAEKKGVNTKVVDFDDEFVKGIMEIYNETPIRQGRKFWHYGKNFNDVKIENSSYPDRSDFIGAYYKKELIGFIKLVYSEGFATIMQIISKIEHRDKAVTNALLARSIEICANKKLSYLVYSTFIYGKKGVDSLANFKRHNAFEKIDLPRYYIPLSIKGKFALKLNLHHGFTELLPKFLIIGLMKLRSKLYLLKHDNISQD